MFFRFPEDARWKPIGRQSSSASVSANTRAWSACRARSSGALSTSAITPERCLEAFHLQRMRFELIVERKLRNRQLTDDGNVEITGRDLRTPRTAHAATRYTPRYADLSSRNELHWPQARD
jgi:hypothetical protein